MASGKNPTSRIETITPKKAQQYLEANTHNRHVRNNTVQFYAKQMAEGDWELTGEPIIFSDEGVLLNGQHRLHACIESNSSFKTFVVRGSSDDSFAKIDQNVPRQAGDIVGRAGYAQAIRKAAASRIILAFEELDDSTADNHRPALAIKRPHAEVLGFVEKNNDILSEGCSLAIKDDGPSICKPPALFVGLYVLFATKNRKRAKEFFHQLVSGEILERDDATARLRAALISSLSNTHVKRKKTWILAVTIKAWNLFLQDKQIRQLKFGENENWPKIRARK